MKREHIQKALISTTFSLHLGNVRSVIGDTRMDYFYAISTRDKDYTLLGSMFLKGTGLSYKAIEYFPVFFPSLNTEKIKEHVVDLSNTGYRFGNLHSWIFDYQNTREALKKDVEKLINENNNQQESE